MNHEPKHSNENDPTKGFLPDDVDWLAFCYLADELDEEQRAAFELRLENDEQAQNSLVDAMRESQLVFASLNTTSFNGVQERAAVSLAPQAIITRADQRSRSGKRLGWLLGSAATIFLLIGSWIWFSNPSNGTSELAANSVSAASSDLDLASAWVDTIALMNSEDLDEIIDEETATEIDEDSIDWMFVALTDLEASDEENEGEIN